MEAKELMIGDWVQDRSGAKMKIMNIEYHCTRVLHNGEELILAYFEHANLMPIPLTPEILEKNGFEDIGDDTYQLEEKPYWFWVDFFNHQYGCEYDTSTHEYEDDEHRLKLYGIPSVHELQHALRLCGIEKEIIL